MIASISSQARRRMIIAAAALGALLAVLVALLIGERHLKSIVVHALRVHTGRAIRIDSDLEVHLVTRHPRVRAQSVVIDNPPWMDPGTTATAARVDGLLEWQFAWPPLAIARLQIEQAQVNLVRDEEGHANWLLHENGPGGGLPLMHSLSMKDARVQLHDARRHVEFDGIVSAQDTGADGSAGPLRIVGRGQLNGRAAEFSITGDPLARAERGHPYHFEFEERSGTAHLTGRGQLERAMDFRDLQGEFVLRGQDLADLYYLLGLRAPQSGTFGLTGKLARHGRDYTYSELLLKSGDSDLEGTVHIRTEPPGGRDRYEAQLSSSRIRLADLGRHAREEAGAAAPPAPEEGALRLPSAPLRIAALQKSDALVKFRGQELDVGPVALTGASAQITLERGDLSVGSLQAGVLGGRLSGQARLDVSRGVPRGSADLTLTDARLHEFKRADGSAPALELEGALDGRAQLRGSGSSWHAIAASADGTLTLVMPHGTVRAALAEAASLELAGALGLLTKSRKETPVRCGVVSLEGKDGVFAARTLVLDTDKALITGGGSVRMDTESLDLTLHGRPKRPALLLRSGVAVRGTLAHPQFGLSGGGVAAQSGAAAALGVLLTPLASVLAFVSPGLAHDADCQRLLTEYQPVAQAPPH